MELKQLVSCFKIKGVILDYVNTFSIIIASLNVEERDGRFRMS